MDVITPTQPNRDLGAAVARYATHKNQLDLKLMLFSLRRVYEIKERLRYIDDSIHSISSVCFASAKHRAKQVSSDVRSRVFCARNAHSIGAPVVLCTKPMALSLSRTYWMKHKWHLNRTLYKKNLVYIKTKNRVPKNHQGDLAARRLQKNLEVVL